MKDCVKKLAVPGFNRAIARGRHSEERKERALVSAQESRADRELVCAGKSASLESWARVYGLFTARSSENAESDGSRDRRRDSAGTHLREASFRRCGGSGGAAPGSGPSVSSWISLRGPVRVAGRAPSGYVFTAFSRGSSPTRCSPGKKTLRARSWPLRASRIGPVGISSPANRFHHCCSMELRGLRRVSRALKSPAPPDLHTRAHPITPTLPKSQAWAAPLRTSPCSRGSRERV